MTPHNLTQHRARLLREIAHFAERVSATAAAETPAQRTAHTRALRCLTDRARRLAELPWSQP